MSTHYLKAMEEGRFNNIPKVFNRDYSKICEDARDGHEIDSGLV